MKSDKSSRRTKDKEKDDLNVARYRKIEIQCEDEKEQEELLKLMESIIKN